MKTKWILLVCVTVLALSVPLGGCRRAPQPAEEQPPEASEPTPATPVPDTTSVRVYLLRGEKIGVGGRQVDASSDDVAALAEAALNELMIGPTVEEREFGLASAIPTGTMVNGVTIDNGVATVDLSQDFQSGGGSLSMLLRVTQVVCTVTQFDEIESVAFAITGKKVDTIGGEGVVVDPPVNRADFEGQLPPVLVETPFPGETVESPIPVSGSSNVYEATHQLQLTDPEGKIIYDQPVTASSGTGTRGTWRADIPYEVTRDGLASLIVFEYSAKDGSRQNVVEIPVRLVK